MFSDTLAQTRRLWGGDAAQDIKNLKLGPLRDSGDGGIETRYMLDFMIDYGPNGRPAGAANHGSVTLQETPDGWKVDGFGSSIDPTLP